MLSYMTIELALLAASVVLGIVNIIIVSHLQSWQLGYWWTASSREQSVAPLTGIAGRAERALRNYLETFPFFAAAILVVTVTNTHTGSPCGEPTSTFGVASPTQSCTWPTCR
jgi:uncharacterized MAPEG superfamily protein